MKGKDMIKLITEHHLENFDLGFDICYVNKFGVNVNTYSIDNICDIGYSQNAVSFEGELK